MKMRTIFLLCLAAALIQQSCSDKCGGGNTYWANFVNVNSALCENDVVAQAGTSMASGDLRIKIFGELVPDEQGEFYDPPCSTVPGSVSGLEYRITELRVICDRDIAHIPAGVNLITEINPMIRWGGLYSWRPGEWIENMNKCRIDDIYRGTVFLRPGITYEFDIDLLPYFITVEEGAYTFSLIIKFSGVHPSEKTYQNTFPTVTLR